MAGFDDPGLFYQNTFFANEDDAPNDPGHEIVAQYKELQTQFRRFLREYNTGHFEFDYRLVVSVNFIFC